MLLLSLDDFDATETVAVVWGFLSVAAALAVGPVILGGCDVAIADLGTTWAIFEYDNGCGGKLVAGAGVGVTIGTGAGVGVGVATSVGLVVGSLGKNGAVVVVDCWLVEGIIVMVVVGVGVAVCGNGCLLVVWLSSTAFILFNNANWMSGAAVDFFFIFILNFKLVLNIFWN